MSLDSQFKAPMIHTIVVDHYSSMSTSGYGVRTYSTASTFKARIEFKRRTVKDSQQRDIISNTTIFTPTVDKDGTSATIGNSDKITLPVAFSPRTPPIISVEPHYDHEGLHHYEILV